MMVNSGTLFGFYCSQVRVCRLGSGAYRISDLQDCGSIGFRIYRVSGL